MQYKRVGNAILFNGDAIDIIPKLKNCYIDCVISDPPYGISYDSWDVLHDNTNSSLLGDGKKRKRSSKPIRGWCEKDGNIGTEYKEWCKMWSISLASKCKPASALIFFNSRRLMHNFIAGFDNFLLQDILCHIKSSSYFQAFRPFPDTMPHIRIGNLAPSWGTNISDAFKV